MSGGSEAWARRREIVVDGTRLSYLHAGSGRPVLLPARHLLAPPVGVTSNTKATAGTSR